MKRRFSFLLLVAALEMAQAPPPFVFDSARIQNVLYAPDRVVPLQAAFGYAVVIELSEDERVENVVVGNSGGWQITPNQRGDHLIVKPGEGAETTDLVVSTDARRYVFLLQAAKLAPSTPFVMHFYYPTSTTNVATATFPPTMGRPVAPLPALTDYKLRGDRKLFPLTITDDGHRTTVSWSRSTPLPAMYAVDDHGHEALVNGRMVGNAYVVEGVATGFVFRLGKAHATATRQVSKAAHK